MPKLSPGVELAWQAGADEALHEGGNRIEPYHLLIGACSISKFLAAGPDSGSQLTVADLALAQREWQAWVAALAEASLYPQSFRRALRLDAAPFQKAENNSPEVKVRRSAASHDAFERAENAAISGGVPTVHLLHLVKALLDSFEKVIEACLARLSADRTLLSSAVSRGIAILDTAGISPASIDLQHSDLRISGQLDASLAVYTLSPKASQDAARLALFYELPLQFGRGGTWNQLLQETMVRLAQVLPGTTHAALLVKDRVTGELLLEAHVPAGTPSVSLTLAQRVLDAKQAFLWTRGKDDPLLSLDAHGLQSGVYAPLIWQGETLGVVCVASARTLFGHEDLRLVAALAHHAGMALANFQYQGDLRSKTELLERLMTNFSPRIRSALLDKASRGRLRLGGEKSEVTLLCSDIRQFTQLSSGLRSEEIVDLLNDYFAVLVDVLFRHDGTIDKFIGDGILAVFGSPEPDSGQHLKAVRAALAMQNAMLERSEARRARGQVTCEIGIGLHCGEVLHGFIGTPERMEFTVIGDAVNRTSRYCDSAKCSEILMSPELFQRVWKAVQVEACSITTKHEGDFQAYHLKGAKP